MSGQAIKKEKTTLTFSRNVSNGSKVAIHKLWGIRMPQQHDKYLGLSAIVGRSRRCAFGEIKQKLWSKLQSWKKKLLS